MNSYAIYRIAETIRIMFFVVVAMTVFNFYPITTVMIILLALLNDLPIMTIAYDNTWLDPKPVRWNMRRVLTVSTTIGLVGVIQTFIILVIGREVLHFNATQIQSLIFIKLAFAGHLTLLVVRTRKSFLHKPYPAPILLIAIIGTKIIAAAIVGFGILVTPIPWAYIGLVFLYCLAWMFLNDWVKREIYSHFSFSGKRHQTFLKRLQESLHPHG
jgi:H+-transporting ATPase